MHIHILGVCGTFMGSLAILAKELGHHVSGSDQSVYPPMSTQLEQAGIELMQGYKAEHLTDDIDLVVVGNAMSRGNPAVEAVLNKGMRYTSGPQWLADEVLQGRWVLAVAGTHGKTTTSSLLAWILEYANLKPGFLIGGVPKNFSVSARLGDTPFFVIEADEYDTAFFDKRSKCIHYRPRTAIINNLEFDHADIFDNLAAIQKQLHHFVRTVPGEGLVIVPAATESIEQTLAMGCWTPVHRFGKAEEGADLTARCLLADGSEFEVLLEGEVQAVVSWSQTGEHNVNNALAAILAARHVGVAPAVAAAALCEFAGAKRRMELLAEVDGVSVYDDFAHHPTAIATTLEGLRNRFPQGRIRAVIEPRSNTMRLGTHRGQLAPACKAASEVFWYQPVGVDWDLAGLIPDSPVPAKVMDSIDKLVDDLVMSSQPGDQIVVMSNGGFAGIHQKLITALQAKG